MKNLLIIFLFFLLCSSSECGELPLDVGFEKEPTIGIAFENGTRDFETYSESANIAYHRANYDSMAGIDMNSTQTKFWIKHNSKTDSFILKYKLKTEFFGKRYGKKHSIFFDSLSIVDNSFSNVIYDNDSIRRKNKWYDPCLVFYIIK